MSMLNVILKKVHIVSIVNRLPCFIYLEVSYSVFKLFPNTMLTTVCITLIY